MQSYEFLIRLIIIITATGYLVAYSGAKQTRRDQAPAAAARAHTKGRP